MPARGRFVFIWIGLLLYAASFALFATAEHPPSTVAMRGYLCAYIALLQPWGHDGWAMLHEKPLEYLSILISGWINPLFVLTLVLGLFKVPRIAMLIARDTVVAMIPFCWIVFHYLRLYPREGHFVWIVGMLLTFFGRTSR